MFLRSRRSKKYLAGRIRSGARIRSPSGQTRRPAWVDRGLGMMVVALIGLACAGYVVVPPPRGHAAVVARGVPDQEINIGFFFDRLAVHGDWIHHGRYGWVWIPSYVPYGWRPYTYGHWVYTDDDQWLWLSDWDWGWGPFHYGRWHLDRTLGWIWVPGYVWAPAWVAWRRGDGYVGWAALGPRFEWDVSVGFRWFDVSVLTGPVWVFVPERHFLDRDVRDRIAPPSRNLAIKDRTRDVSDIVSRRGQPVDRSISRSDLEATIGTIRRTRVRTVETPAELRVRRPAPDEEFVFRPMVHRDTTDPSPPGLDALDRRQRIEREVLDERHRAILHEFERRYRDLGPLDRATADRRAAERREIDRQITRERQVLKERQARERRKIRNQ